MALVQSALRAKGAGLISALREMDTNGDGDISSREFCRAVNRLEGIDVTQQETMELYKYLLAGRPAPAGSAQAKAHLTIAEMVKLFDGDTPAAGGATGAPVPGTAAAAEYSAPAAAPSPAPASAAPAETAVAEATATVAPAAQRMPENETGPVAESELAQLLKKYSRL